MTTGQTAIAVIVFVFLTYLFFRFSELRRARKKIEEVASSANSHNERAQELLIQTVKNTIAVNENSALLRTNIALLRELLDKQETSER